MRLARERGLLLRANPWSEGDGLDFARARGAELAGDLGEFYGRVMPAPPARIDEEDFVRLSQLYGREARIFTDDWREITPPHVAWHENDLAQLIGPRAWYVVAETNERIEAARAAGGEVVERDDGTIAVHVAAAVTHTLGGLRVDEQARVVGTEGSGRRASTPAASRAAATRAASRRRLSSALSRPSRSPAARRRGTRRRACRPAAATARA